MPKNFQRISELGFKKVGYWHFVGEQLDFHVDPDARDEKNLLYAFITNGVLAYVGKTTQLLKDRLQRYKTPAKNGQSGGSTNIKNNKNIRAKLLAGESVEIHVFLTKEENSLAGFSVNLAAALEDSLINELRPPWNGRDTAAKKTQMPKIEVPQVELLKKIPRSLSVEDFKGVLRQKIEEADALNLRHIDIVSGALHREIGGYPGRSHAMPVCCSVMRGEMKHGDEVLAAPPKGKGATLRIRYLLPR